MFKKVLTLMTLIVMLFAFVMVILLCSCSGGNGQTTEAVSQVFQADDTAEGISQPDAAGNAEVIEGQITLPDGDSIGSVAVWNGTVYIAGGHGLYAAPLTGGTASPLCETSGSIDALAPTDDGIWIMSGEELIHIGADGSELAHADTAGFFEDGVYVSITGAPNGSVIVYSSDTLYVIDSSGAADEITFEDGYCRSLAMLDNGDVVGYFCKTDALGSITGEYLARIDPSSGRHESLGPYEGHSWTTVAGGNSSTVWIDNGSSVSAYDTASQSITKTVNWLNVGIDANNLAAAAFGADNAVSALEYTDNHTALYVHPVQTAQDAGTSVLTLAVFGGLTSIQKDAVIAFNSTHSDMRLEVKDYMEYGNISAAIEQFNYDVLAGDIPDIIDLTAFSYDTLAGKGLLLDLYPYLDADPELSRSDFLSNVLTASETDGALLSVIPCYLVGGTAVAERGVFDKDAITLADLKQALSEHPGMTAFGATVRTELLTALVTADAEQYIDIDTGRCSFDSAAFLELLEFVGQQPELDIEALHMGYEGEPGLLRQCSLEGFVTEFDYEMGGNRSYVGLPGVNGTKPLICPVMEFGISSETKAPEACWEFLRELLTFDSQTRMTNEYWGLPLRTDCLNSFEAYTQALALSDGIISEDNISEAKTVILSADRAERRFSMLSEVLEIVQEEAQAYFSGAKTAEDVANGIQSRANIYMAEQG